MSLKKLLFVTLGILFFQITFAQRNYQEFNHLGVSGGIGFFDIETDNFSTQQGSGFIFAFTTRGMFYNSFDLIYGISFVQNEVGIFGNNPGDISNNLPSQYVNYSIQSAQITLLTSYNIVRNHLSLEAGPILNVNGKLKLNSDNFKDFILEGYETLKAEDIQNVSKVNFFLAGGITAGIENFRLGAQYQYGVTNLFNRFNDIAEIEKPKEEKYNGHASTVLLTAVLYF
jgi:hypothetical protein